MDISNGVFFQDICVMLGKVKKVKKLAQKELILQKYYESFKKFREAFRGEHGIAQQEEDGRSSFYCVLRCLIPGSDNARKPYGLQISTLGKAYIKVLQLSDDSIDAERLRARSYSGIHGDYAEIVHKVLSTRCREEPSKLTLKEVHEMLDKIADDDIRNTEKILTRLSETAPAVEQMWFIRLLLKSMHLGIGEQRIFAIIHPMAHEVYRRCSNLQRVCCLLSDERKIAEATADETNSSISTAESKLNLNDAIVPFQHIRPMLCEVFRGNIAPIMAADVLYMETKMDGERFQLHYADGRFKYISRNGVDYTHSFGGSYESGPLTSQLEHLLPIGMHDIILDGEMMVYDTRQGRFRDKGENTDVKNLNSRPGWAPCFVIYDLLYYNGTSLLDMPYVQRAHKITELVKEKPGVLQILRAEKVTSLEEFQRMFQEALNAKEEGVVLKKQNSVYRPGMRNGGGWYKVKADYIAGLTTEFDLLIIGGFFNRRRSFIDSFLVGVLKYISPEKFEVYSVGKVSNCTRQRVVLNDTFKSLWKPLVSEPPPAWYHYVESSAEGRPDVWVEPKKSSILQIKATDLSPSSAFSLKKTLHFPRIEAWRNDKVWNECMSVQDFEQMIQGQGGLKKINKRELSLEDFTNERKRTKLTPAEKRKLGMQAYEKRFNPTDIEQSSTLFEGFSICVLSGSPRKGYSPQDLKALVVRNGGEITENPLQDSKCISVAGDITFRVETLKKSQRYNIVTLMWLLKACEEQEMRFRPKDMIAMTEDVKQQLTQLFDEYSDSYTDFVSVNELEELFADIPDEKIASFELLENEKTALETILYADDSLEFFYNNYACFYSNEQRSQLASLIFQFRAGSCIDITAVYERRNVNFIFINIEHFKKPEFNLWLAENFKDQLNNLKIVNIDWIMDSHRAARMLDVHEYTWLEF